MLTIKQVADARDLWRMGGDTVEIARVLRVSEPEVYGEMFVIRSAAAVAQRVIERTARQRSEAVS